MKILLMIIFVINCLPSTTFYQVYLFPQQIPVISLFFYRKNLKSPGFENFNLTGLKLCKSTFNSRMFHKNPQGQKEFKFFNSRVVNRIVNFLVLWKISDAESDFCDQMKKLLFFNMFFKIRIT